MLEIIKTDISLNLCIDSFKQSCNVSNGETFTIHLKEMFEHISNCEKCKTELKNFYDAIPINPMIKMGLSTYLTSFTQQ